MLRRLLLLTCFLIVAVAALAAPKPSPAWKQSFNTHNGVVLLGYAQSTSVVITTYGDRVVWRGTIGNTDTTCIPLKAGHHTVAAADEIKVISIDLAAYQTGAAPPEPVSEMFRPHPRPQIVSPVPVAVPVPWVADATYADSPPSYASSHVVFNDVVTTLKVVAQGGVPPYSVHWVAGDGGTVNLAGITDGYNGCAASHIYTGVPVGTQLKATATITDSNGNTASADYWVVVGDPGDRANRRNRASDEGLWFLHRSISRDYTTYLAPIGWISSSIAPTATACIAMETTGRSISGGKNFSHDPLKDALVEDLDLMINYLAHPSVLIATNISASNPKTYGSGASINPDTHGPGGVPNGLAAVPYSGSIYEAGMHLQALCQAGYVDKAIPIRADYASFFDLIGDFVDMFQWSQAANGWAEGGWRYWTVFNGYDSADGSTAAWAYIGLRAAEVCNLQTPSAVPPAPIIVDGTVKNEAKVRWQAYDQDRGDATSTYGTYDYRLAVGRNAHYYGGFGYDAWYSGTNAGKTGGGLAGLKLVGIGSTDPEARLAESYLYRTFYCPDSLFGWSSARDAYGMYNMFKGLREAGITTLTDPLSPDGVVDYDGLPLIPIDWFNAFVDFIAGTSATDLGHAAWPGNAAMTGRYFSWSTDGHFEPTGTNPGDWGAGSSDGSCGQYIVTAFDIAIMNGAVFVPSPKAVIAHPEELAGENFVPAGTTVIFDPAGSYETNPSARINHVKWTFGEGSPVEYDLPFPSPIGGTVPDAPGMHPAGNQTSHMYTAEGDYAASLTVYDDAGNTDTKTITVHVTPPPFSPVPQVALTAMGGSRQAGNVVGVLADGTVSMKIDGSSSYNPRPDRVDAPKNANGISRFWFEWPANPGGGGFNSGISEYPNLFDEGAPYGGTDLNSGSADPLQTYTFQFDPAHLPSAISVGIRVKSNLSGPAPLPPDTVTIFKQIRLVPNCDIAHAPVITVSNKSGAVGTNVTLTATIKGDGAPLAGVTLTFTVGAWSASGVTDASGTAAVVYPIAGSLGDRTINVTYTGSCDGLWDNAAGTGTLTVTGSGERTQTVVLDRSAAVTDRLRLVAYLRKPGTFIGFAGKTLTFSVAGGPGMPSTPTNGEGKADALYVVAPGRDGRPIHAEFAGDADLLASSGTATLWLLPKLGTTITIYNANGTPGSPVTLVGWLYRQHPDGTRDPLGSKVVKFTVSALGVVGIATTNALGYATFTFTIPTSGGGTHPWTLEFAGDADYSSSLAIANLVCGVPGTKVYVPNRTGAIASSVVIRAYLYAATGVVPIAGKALTVSIGGTSIGSGITDGLGLVELPYVVPDGGGSGGRIISGFFAGDASFLPSSGTGTLTVSPAPVYIFVGDRTGRAGTNVVLKAYVRRLPDLQWQVGKFIAYTVAGSAAGSSTTDGSGIASLSYSVPGGMLPGSYPVVGSFAGDAFLATGTSAPGTLTVIP